MIIGDTIKVGETSLVMGVALINQKGLTVRKGERCSEIQPYVTAQEIGTKRRIRITATDFDEQKSKVRKPMRKQKAIDDQYAKRDSCHNLVRYT